MKVRNKIYYPAGVMSAMLLPFLCLWHLNSTGALNPIGALDVAMIDYSSVETFGVNSAFISTNRKYTTIKFSGVRNRDSVKVAFAEIAIRELIENKDTVNGVHIALNQKMKHWTFVKVVALTHNENLTAVMDTHNAWFWFKKTTIPPADLSFVCGTNSFMAQKIADDEKEQIAQKYLSQVPKRFIGPFIIYLLMIALTILRVRFL